MDNLQIYYENVMNIVCEKFVESFNNTYNVSIKKDEILNDLVEETNDDTENTENTEPLVEKMDKLRINNICIGIKKNKERCKNKAIIGHMYCGMHIRSEGKIPFKEYIKNVSTQFNYKDIPKVVSLGNQWVTEPKQNDQKNWKYPLEIDKKSNEISTHIIFFNEFKNYFGAGIFIIQYCSQNKKDSYFMATHYVEVNKYAENLESELYTKISFKPIASLNGKPIFNKVKSFLEEYGIPYNINEINKHHTRMIEKNPTVIYTRLNKIIDDYCKSLYFHYKAYVNSYLEDN